mmetsp:Transcript_24745/g.68414  ORF Transcript_24745/g.68414 Transcript_24745/m.68414 type:complete len:319 (-) Transcript_24745:257-1213(-)
MMTVCLFQNFQLGTHRRLFFFLQGRPQTVVAIPTLQRRQQSCKVRRGFGLAHGFGSQIERPTGVVVGMPKRLEHDLGHVFPGHGARFRTLHRIVHARYQGAFAAGFVEQTAGVDNGVLEFGRLCHEVHFGLAFPLHNHATLTGTILSHGTTQIVEGMIRIGAAHGGTQDHLSARRAGVNLILLTDPVHEFRVALGKGKHGSLGVGIHLPARCRFGRRGNANRLHVGTDDGLQGCKIRHVHHGHGIFRYAAPGVEQGSFGRFAAHETEGCKFVGQGQELAKERLTGLTTRAADHHLLGCGECVTGGRQLRQPLTHGCEQ